MNLLVQDRLICDNMKKTILFIFLITATPLFSQNFELPHYTSDSEIIQHTGYSIKYNEYFEQAEWVAYQLTIDEVSGNFERSNNFRKDPHVSIGSATLKDYINSGYDRGHLIPAADMKWSPDAMSASFFMSNMSPQNPSFNRGIWKKLEEQVRKWAVENREFYVVTGPVLTDEPYQYIGVNQVAVPKHYYKVVLDYLEPELKAIGFILPNIKDTYPLSQYAVTVDEVEKITNIDFFYILSDDVEEMLESELDLSLWSLSLSSDVKKDQNVDTTYWINTNSDTRHNSNCRYFGKTKAGYYTNDIIGNPCKICGG